MVKYSISATVPLPSKSAVIAILPTNVIGQLFVVQQNAVTLFKQKAIISTIDVLAEMPLCVASNRLVVGGNQLSIIDSHDNGLQKEYTSFTERVNYLATYGSEIYSASGARLHRHDKVHHLLRTFSEPIAGLTAMSSKLLVVLSTKFHLLNPDTNQDLAEISCDTLNPIDVFWSASLEDKVWFATLVKPAPLSDNRTYRILLSELGEVVTSRDISPVDVSLEKRLSCHMAGNKMVTLAENGNVILIHAIEDFDIDVLLYRANATDVPFSAASITEQSKGRTAPCVALGTFNGAVAFLCETQ